MDTVLGSQLTAAAVVSFLISFLKKQPWFPWLTAETEKTNRIVAVILSGAASIGIHTTFNHQAGTLVISGLTLSTIAAGAWHWGSQFAMTHGWFKATSASDQILVLLKAICKAQADTAAGPGTGEPAHISLPAASRV